MYSTSFSSSLKRETAIKELKKLRNALLIYGVAKCLPPTWKSGRVECLSANENQILSYLPEPVSHLICIHGYQIPMGNIKDIKSLGIWYCMILFQEGEWMLLVTPFRNQFTYVYFQKQNRKAFKIISLQSVLLVLQLHSRRRRLLLWTNPCPSEQCLRVLFLALLQTLRVAVTKLLGVRG